LQTCAYALSKEVIGVVDLLRAGAERCDAERGLVAHARVTIGVRAAIPEALLHAGIRERKAGGRPDAIRAVDLVAVAAEADSRLREAFVIAGEVRVAAETRVDPLPQTSPSRRALR
jgi:hypothetical protein